MFRKFTVKVPNLRNWVMMMTYRGSHTPKSSIILNALLLRLHFLGLPVHHCHNYHCHHVDHDHCYHYVDFLGSWYPASASPSVALDELAHEPWEHFHSISYCIITPSYRWFYITAQFFQYIKTKDDFTSDPFSFHAVITKKTCEHSDHLQIVS